MIVPDNLPHSLKLAEFAFDNGSLDKSSFTFGSAGGPLSTDTLATAISHGAAVSETRDYLSSYELDDVKSRLSRSIDRARCPSFHAASKNRVDVIEVLLEYGVDPKTQGGTTMTLLQYIIVCSYWNHKNIDKMVALLLAHGADPHCVPKKLWQDYIKTPVYDLPMPTDFWARDGSVEDGCDSESKAKGSTFSVVWDKREKQLFHFAMVKSLNLTIRYLLWRVSNIKSPTKRQLQIATSLGCPRLLRMPYFLVGQDHALQLVMSKVLAYDAYDRKRPLVLAFAGLSGHGKTELATQMQYLLATELCKVDMSKVRDTWGLHGSTLGYRGATQGSILNNFLASHEKQKCVVFLDEYDKTEQEVREALLTMLDSGMTVDLRHNTVVNVSKSIWILATNKGDSLVTDFFDKHLSGKSYQEQQQVSIQPLQESLFRLFIQQYTPAVAGRITTFVPFFPFSRDEAAVISHRFLQDLSDRLREPIDLDSHPPNLVGHIRLSLDDDGEICKKLSEDRYMKLPELGARSLQNAVDELADRVFETYIDTDEEVTAKVNEKPMEKYIVQLHPIEDTKEIVVFKEAEAVANGDLMG